jgi:hypothetical protein
MGSMNIEQRVMSNEECNYASCNVKAYFPLERHRRRDYHHSSSLSLFKHSPVSHCLHFSYKRTDYVHFATHTSTSGIDQPCAF